MRRGLWKKKKKRREEKIRFGGKDG